MDFKITEGGNNDVNYLVQPDLLPMERIAGKPTAVGSASRTEPNMSMTRREFVTAGMAGVAGLCAGGCITGASVAANASTLQPDEDGYQLWLRYALPRDTANDYRKVIRRIRVD